MSQVLFTLLMAVGGGFVGGAIVTPYAECHERIAFLLIGLAAFVGAYFWGAALGYV